jgi:hypothetical protein
MGSVVQVGPASRSFPKRSRDLSWRALLIGGEEDTGGWPAIPWRAWWLTWAFFPRGARPVLARKKAQPFELG